MGTDVIIVYTDGSCHTARRVGGWASVILLDEKKIILKGMIENTTHQRMEIYAVLQSLQYIKLQKIAGCEIHIYSDSQYVIGINDRIIKFKASNFLTKKQHPIRNEDLVRSLISCLEELNVRFIKVKAHEKISAYDNINREVDKLARLIVRQHSSQKKK